MSTVKHIPDIDLLKCLPDAEGKMLMCVKFNSCFQSSLYVRLYQVNSSGKDKSGMARDSWWAVTCSDLPDRFFRLMGGADSMLSFLKRYGLVDKQDCMHHKRCELHYSSKFEPPSTHLSVSPRMAASRGVPQFYKNSGVCWFASLCWLLCANKQMLEFFTGFMPEVAVKSVRGCLYDRVAAETFRKFLWYNHKIGDDVDAHPSFDGKNGSLELISICSAFQIPIVVYEASGNSRNLKRLVADSEYPFRGPRTKSERHLLLLRFKDGNHSNKYCPVRRQLRLEGKQYFLIGCFMGHRKCGHQISFARTDLSEDEWGITDADGHKDEIGPMFCKIDTSSEEGWWEIWKFIVSVTRFSRQGRIEYCPLSPWNRNDDQYRGSPSCTNSIDMLFLSE